MAEALAEVKRDLGRDAVILHTRSFRKGGLLGIWRRPMWEITASPNLNVPERIGKGTYICEPADEVADDGPAQGAAAQSATAQTPSPQRPPAAPGGALGKCPVDTVPTADPAESASPSPGASPTAPCEPAADATGVAEQLKGIHRMLEALLASPGAAEGNGSPGIPPDLHELHNHLVDQDVQAPMAAQLIKRLCMDLTGQQLADRQVIRQELRRLVAQRIRTAGKDLEAMPAAGQRARVIALIGPTGVGKTTTIAKLAANYRLTLGRKVGLITIDTYRIAAVDQLRTYAEILGVPLKAALTAGELHEAIHAMRDMDVVLIDTAGRSQHNQIQIGELRNFMGAARPDQMHLVISATANRACTQSVLDQFGPLGANHLIVTKLDEAGTFGVFLNVSAAEAMPLSYVTTGQGVPNDISRANAEHLAECILTGRCGGQRHGG
jgi:flagellar biosynthesis protein FlhF